MKTTIKRLASAAAAIALVGGMSACSQDGAQDDSAEKDPATSSEEAPAEEGEEGEAEEGDDEAGFREEPIGDEVFEGPIKVAAVYFQPVTMEPEMGVPYTEASMHIEADIAAVPDNGLGYGAGDFIPGLTVDYKILNEDGSEAQSGTLMPMNASDGPHYGLNLPALDAGTYTLQFIVHSPEENGWMLHTDAETGVPGEFWAEPIVAEFPDWNWDPAAAWW
ncbi:MAG: iron transporter [Actinomycetaceae bacterium]|nr:iron transporter [Actinomycetaceae bacterium]